MRFPRPPVVPAPTPNFGYPRGARGRQGHPVLGICYHIAEGSRAAVTDWFANPDSEASSHFLICRDGTIVQFVDETDVAWTQGRAVNPTWPLYDPAVNPNLVLIGIEHEGHSGQEWTEGMYRADLALTLHLCERFQIPPLRPYLLGHNEIDPRDRRHCPGDSFPWARLLAELAARQAEAVPPALQPFRDAAIRLGISDGSRPLDPATRGEVMTMAVRAVERLGAAPAAPAGPLELEHPVPGDLLPWVRKARAWGLTDGSRPGAAATRGEAMAMALRALRVAAQQRPPLPAPAPGPAPPPADVPDWLAAVVAAVRQEGLSDGSRPADPCLRVEAMAMAARVVQRFG